MIDESDVIVIGTKSEEFADALMRLRPDQIVIDLVRLPVYASRSVQLSRTLLVSSPSTDQGSIFTRQLLLSS